MADDFYSGVQASWDNKAIQIIEYLIQKQGQPYTYVEIADALGMAITEVGRYLRENAYERRSWKWAENMRKYKPKAYMYYLNNSEIRKVEMDDGNIESILYINFSKHDIFLMNCRLRNVEVNYIKHGNRKMVYLFEYAEDMRTKIYYEKATLDYDELREDDYGSSEDEFDTMSGEYL